MNTVVLTFAYETDVINKNPETQISKDDIEFINFILDNYAVFSGAELESMTHEETPWIEARKGYAPMQACNNVISEQTMQSYYGERWKEINV